MQYGIESPTTNVPTVTASMHNPIAASIGRSTLTQQLEQNDGDRTPRSSRFTSVIQSPTKQESSKPALSPSPAFREPARLSKDDSSIAGPSTPRRPSFHVRGLSLQMPPRELQDNALDPALARAPLSPKLDASQIYGSPSSMLPRRSRGMDYTRACTNLHHSTLAESSPDASPVTGRGINIPQRRSLGNNTVLDSPSNATTSLWPGAAGERTTLSSSISSVNMLDSDSDTDSSDDMAIDRQNEDVMLNTPAASRLNGSFLPMTAASPGGEWLNPQPSPAQASLMTFQPNRSNFRRLRLRKGRSHHSSSSVSAKSSKPSPGPLSPGIVKSVEGSTGNYFGLAKQQLQLRRESLSLGTGDLHLSDSEDGSSKFSTTATNLDHGSEENPWGVIRRAVTRRSNLLPKTKGFARIKAALMEESQPVDHELRREAEVIRQVHENEPPSNDISNSSAVLDNPLGFTAEPIETSIENMVPALEALTGPKLDGTRGNLFRAGDKGPTGLGFWNTFDDRYRTPPPSLIPRENSMTTYASDDTSDNTPGSSNNVGAENPTFKYFQRPRSRSTTPLAGNNPPTANEVARRVNNKRRRDDDFDPAYAKRRAVSPGMSVQSSPVLPQSPVMTSDNKWGWPPAKSGNGDRSNSGGSMSMKRIGLQGMTETSDGLMSMSID